MGAPVAEGQVLAGKYRVEQILGQGGMGVVVAAVHQQLQQRVAIKFLLPGASHDATARFLREARAAVRLKSEHVARVSDVGELEGGTPYMVMEYLDGTDLSHLVRQRGALPIEEAVTYVLHACEAIAEAHAIGIIHRDIKPANLFLTTGADGSQTVKVLDFGISTAGAPGADTAPGAEPAMSLTQTEMMLGSPLYMSPEQMRSAKTVDHRADIWSMGALLYQLVTGTVPFNTTSLAELILMINTQDPPPPRAYRPDLPEGLEAAILGCLRRNVQERFTNMGELALALAPFAPEEETGRSLPRILRTLGMAGSLARSVSTASGAYRTLSPSLSGVSTPSTAPPAYAQSGVVGPYAATTPSGPPAMTQPGAHAQGVTAPTAQTAQGAGAMPSVPPPAVARTSEGLVAVTGMGAAGEPVPNAATAAGWTAAGGPGAPRSAGIGKAALVAAAVLLVGVGSFVAVTRMGSSSGPAAVANTPAEMATPLPPAPAPTPTPEPTPAPSAAPDVTATNAELVPTPSTGPSAVAPHAPSAKATTAPAVPSSKQPLASTATKPATPAPSATPAATTTQDPFQRLNNRIGQD
ncbi:serine/threonine-protein kinase [Chondromyces apiculatus]|uniref:Serine/threonine-protein kinase pkn3 n=1 Tax=Chondromyces apiculatus DSM 436 TaxID=1192034 RepID=A0A017SWU0_9BACT|nr:serine/threonine-protein kinase [Chondromyces apiculatus]EYF01434.1 Serine/threonine-protein kinase pkn3 [Chondromyces apiculatus DSM 436]